METEVPRIVGDTDRVEKAKHKLAIALSAVEGQVPENFDRKNAFLVYASQSGDEDRTALALGINRSAVLRLVIEEGWEEKIAGLIRLRKSGKPQQVERGLNRALNFCLSQRMRMVIERLMRRLETMSDEEMLEYSFTSETTRHKDGTETTEKRFNARPFADLGSALEKCTAVSYAALSDTPQERKAHRDEATGPSEAEIHSTIAAAISRMNIEAGPAGAAVERLLTTAEGRTPITIKDAAITIK